MFFVFASKLNKSIIVFIKCYVILKYLYLININKIES